MKKVITIICLAGVLTSIVICEPNWLVKNSFLDDFMGSNFISMIGVLLSVTTASVSHVILSINRYVRDNHPNNSEIRAEADKLIKEIKENMSLIFAGFIAALASMFFIGIFPDDSRLEAALYAFNVWMLTGLSFCIFDIYTVSCGISEMEGR